MSGQAFSKDPFMLEYCLDIDIRHKKLGIKLLIIFYQHQNLFLIRLLQIKWLKNLYVLFTDEIYTFLMKILVMLHFQVTKWVFLVQILIILTLMKLTLMKIILKLLLTLDFWLDTINLQQWKIFKKRNKKRIIVCNMASNKMVRLVHTRRWRKKIEPFFTDEK